MTREEQWEAIQELKAQHKQALADFDEACRVARIEIESENNRQFDRLYMKMGGRRDHSTPATLAAGRVRSPTFQP